jgi:hypothetical protein
MAVFQAFYVVFNQCECLIWWAFGAYFVWRVSMDRGAMRVAEALLIVGFFFFGLSDYVESNDQGGPPLWLWLWKIGNGCAIFALLIWRDYAMRGRVALNPWRFIAAGVVLGLAMYGVIRG